MRRKLSQRGSREVAALASLEAEARASLKHGGSATHVLCGGGSKLMAFALHSVHNFEIWNYIYNNESNCLPSPAWYEAVVLLFLLILDVEIHC